MISKLWLSSFSLLTTPTHVSPIEPLASGYVTSIQSPDIFRLNGQLVRIDPKATFHIEIWRSFAPFLAASLAEAARGAPEW